MFNGGYGFQNSENLAFSEFAALGFNPLENTSYLVTFSAFNGTQNLATVEATINATPVPAALPLFLSAGGVLAFLGRRRKAKGLPLSADA